MIKSHTMTTPTKNKDIFNIEVKQAFLSAYKSGVIEGKKEKIKMDKKYRTGGWQWADKGRSFNIMNSKSACPNDCTYCYVKPMNLRFHRPVEVADIEDFQLHDKRVTKNWAKAKEPYLYMFPSSHDIFPSMVDSYISVVKKMLQAGHDLMLVSKPRKECMVKIMDELEEWKDRITMRFSISTDDVELMKEFEPNAPNFEERLDCLVTAFERGYATSVSLEPYISDPVPLVEKLEDFVSKDIWIGLMNHKHAIYNFDKIEHLYEKEYVKKIVDKLIDNEKVFWKESVMELFVKFVDIKKN